MLVENFPLIPEPKRECGTCTLCCKLLEVSELEKPRGKWCHHCDKGKGCMVYPDRPISCAEFTCGWLQGALPIELDPKITRCVFTMGTHPTKHILVHIDPVVTKIPAVVRNQIETFKRTGNHVVTVQGELVFLYSETPEKFV